MTGSGKQFKDQRSKIKTKNQSSNLAAPDELAVALRDAALDARVVAGDHLSFMNKRSKIKDQRSKFTFEKRSKIRNQPPPAAQQVAGVRVERVAHALAPRRAEDA